MTAPPTTPVNRTTATSPTGAIRRSDNFLNPRIVAREAAKVLNDRGVEVRPGTLRKLVTRFIRSGHTTTRDLEPFILAYLDPTGETAVRNVMAGRA